MAGYFAAWGWYRTKPVASVPQTDIAKSNSDTKAPEQQQNKIDNKDGGSDPEVTADADQATSKKIPETPEPGGGEITAQPSNQEQTPTRPSSDNNNSGIRPPPAAGLGTSGSGGNPYSNQQNTAVDALKMGRQQGNPHAVDSQEKGRPIAPPKKGVDGRGGKGGISSSPPTGPPQKSSSQGGWEAHGHETRKCPAGKCPNG